MSSSSSDAAAPARAHLGELSPTPVLPRGTWRGGPLTAAIAASVALHAYAIFLLDSLPRGMRWGDLSMLDAGSPTKPLSVAMRGAAPAPWVPPVAPAVPAPPAAAAPAAPDRADPAPGAGSAPSPALAPLPATSYFQSRDLDVKPGILVRVEPDYPEAAARRFLSGRVVVRLLISEAGAVEAVGIVSAEPPGYFEESAKKAFLAARFSPGMKGGRPVRAQMMLEVTFESPLAPKPPAGVTS